MYDTDVEILLTSSSREPQNRTPIAKRLSWPVRGMVSHVVTVEQALVQIAEGKDFDSLSDALMDLTPAQATTLPSGCPYSIATLVFHMWFWQDRWLKQIAGTHCEPFHGDESDFLSIEASDWTKTRDTFFEGFKALQERTHHVAVFDKTTQFGDTIQGLLLRAALHTSYHVGQIVLLRRLV